MCYYGNTHSKIQDYLKQYEKEWTRYFWHEFVLKNKNKIDLNFLSENPNITWEFVKDNINKPWNWNIISWNDNITIEFIEKYPNKDWNWGVFGLPGSILSQPCMQTSLIHVEYMSTCSI